MQAMKQKTTKTAPETLLSSARTDKTPPEDLPSSAQNGSGAIQSAFRAVPAKKDLTILPALLLPWYGKNRRVLPWRENTDPYRVWISEIMLQQTRVEAVKEKYLQFLAALPNVFALADCSEDTLMKLWEGLGYYSRARNLQKAARMIAQNGFPETAEELKKLPGIGDYTAGAIASIAFEQAAPAVDGNVVRVLSRVLADTRDAATLKTAFQQELAPVYPPKRRGDFTQSLMELGATVCLPSSPLCGRCPLQKICKTRGDALPAKREKPQKRQIKAAVLLFRSGGGIWLCKRINGLLKGTYGFFFTQNPLQKDQLSDFLSRAGLQNFSFGKSEKHRHVFSHVEWDMTAYVVDTEENVSALSLPDGYFVDNEGATDFSALRLFSVQEAVSSLSVPSAFRWCLDLLL